MASDFNAAFDFVIGAEGGYVNDPKDPGGETKYGISKRAYPGLDIASLTIEQARDIYHLDYWLPAGCESLDQAKALIVFDAAVNQGVSFAKTLVSLSPTAALTVRALRYTQTKNFDRYGKGWLNRLFHLAQEI